jgi:hypothetical protein
MEHLNFINKNIDDLLPKYLTVNKIRASVLEKYPDFAPLAHSPVRLIMKERLRMHHRKTDLSFTSISTTRY